MWMWWITQTTERSGDIMSCKTIFAEFHCDHKGCENTFTSEVFIMPWSSDYDGSSGYDVEADDLPEGWTTHCSVSFANDSHLCSEHAALHKKKS